ncbi:MAG TPA: hypothetical protein VMV18_08480, partial [bacterium]|nr:hypothetical protein [bacterium]
FETYAHKDEKTKRVRGVSTGARLIYTQRIAAYDAKERHGLPESLPLSWSEFDAAAKAGQVSAPPKLREAIAAGAKELGPDAEKFAAEQIAKAGDDAVKLAQILNRVNAKVAEKAKEN